MDNVTGTLNMTIGRMLNLSQGDAINKDGALGEANILILTSEEEPLARRKLADVNRARTTSL